MIASSACTEKVQKRDGALSLSVFESLLQDSLPSWWYNKKITWGARRGWTQKMARLTEKKVRCHGNNVHWTEMNSIFLKRKRAGGRTEAQRVTKGDRWREERRDGKRSERENRGHTQLKSTLKSSGTAAYFMMAFLHEAQLSGWVCTSKRGGTEKKMKQEWRVCACVSACVCVCEEGFLPTSDCHNS